MNRRTLLQEIEDASRSIGSPTPPFASNSPFDSSLALTILVLLTVLFFMAFFSLYIRRFSNNNNNSADPVTRLRQTPSHFRCDKRGGLDPSAVRVLPLVPYSDESKIWSECSICLSEFEDGETVKLIPYCRHGFHPLCIDTWLSSHASCPLCRSTRLFSAVDEGRVSVDGDPTVVTRRD
ncbi:RING-H2 finger protein ATL57-like [Cynara cardunculus var. scolymus]|uniref:RING-type E3 ubiquitin transferase n=1 Tax=Cynara cardunculus var. scolymus TaxID=59895 RepID=A0A124SBI3_CYNCS|nr:RING-H2 finger protein ATL57-like [Cynara cardunculus var. scolymus]KVH90746.1 Zinc finger, RING/FYVE/PHD-type [Cynara cardunculus var. scolymus]